MAQPTHDLVHLMSGVARRDKRAFEDLYRATGAKLFGVILGILSRRSVAEDVLQEVYVRIWERAGDYEPTKGSVIAWMAAIARNRALDERRRGLTHPVSELPENGEFEADIPSALEVIERSDQLRVLVACLDGLEAEKREAVLLAYYRGCSREALSRRYGRPVATIKTWLHRSLLQLRLCLHQ